MQAEAVDTTLNPRVLAVKPAKTMALADLASSMREQGIDVVKLAAGEPDFDTPEAIINAGIEALKYVCLPVIDIICGIHRQAAVCQIAATTMLLA